MGYQTVISGFGFSQILRALISRYQKYLIFRDFFIFPQSGIRVDAHLMMNIGTTFQINISKKTAGIRCLECQKVTRHAIAGDLGILFSLIWAD